MIYHIHSELSAEETAREIRKLGLALKADSHLEWQVEGPPCLVALHDSTARPRISAVLEGHPHLTLLPDLSHPAPKPLQDHHLKKLQKHHEHVAKGDTIVDAMQKVHDNLPYTPAPSFNPKHFQS